MSNQVLNAISLGKQTAWETPVVPDVSIPVNFTGGIQIDQDTQIISALRTQMAKNLYAQKGNTKYEGDFEMVLLADTVGYFLLSWFGAVATTGAGPYVHAFTEDEEKIAYTIEQNFQDLVLRFTGCIANTLKFTTEVGNPVVVAAGIKAKGFAPATAITPVYSDTVPFLSASAEIKVDGSVIASFQTCEIELVNNLEMKYVIGGEGEPQYKYTTGSEVNVSLEGYFNDDMKTKVWDKFENGDLIQIVLTLNGTTPTNEKLVITIPKVAITKTETPIAEDYNKISLEGKGLFDADTASLVTAELTNGVVSY